MFGPRGTGILWGKKEAWHLVQPTIPAFTEPPYMQWLGLAPEGEIAFSDWITSGGYHAFEHRWALKEAFELHDEVGKSRIQERTHALNTQLKEGLQAIKSIKLHISLSTGLSSGINCFEIDGLDSRQTVAKLHDKGIIATASPYRPSYARLTPSIVNTKEEIDKTLTILQSL